MIKYKKITTFLLSLLLVVFVSFVTWEFLIKQSPYFQEKLWKYEMLNNGEKLWATYVFVYESDGKFFKKIVPTIILDVNNFSIEKSIWDKGKPITISCGVSTVLDRYINSDIGTTCELKGKQREYVVDQWKQWYKNKYPEWIKEQEKLEEIPAKK